MRSPVLLGLLAVVATIAGLLVANAARTEVPPGASDAPGASRPPTTQGPALPPPPPGTTYRDFIFETAAVKAPAASRAGSRLWHAAGAWWAALTQPATDRTMIFRLDPATQQWIDTGTLIDERPFADPDVLWTGEHLYVVSAGHNPSERHAGRLLRFSPSEDGTGYTLDPNFPVEIFPTGTTAATVAVDSTGVVWVAYVADGRVRVVHSLEHDAHWAAPFDLPVEHAPLDPVDIASVVAYGPGHVGIAWTSQLEDSVFFAQHTDGEAPDVWSPAATLIDGLGVTDERLDVKRYPLADGGSSVAVAVRTVDDDVPGGNDLAPLIQLVVRGEDGTWRANLVSQVREKQARAILLVDEDARMFYVALTTPARGGVITYKRSPIDVVSFESGPGEPLVASEEDVAIGDLNATKQGLTAETGLVVIAADEDTGRYLHGVVDLGGGPPSADPADPTRPDRPIAPETGAFVLVDADFEPWEPGDASGTSWLPRDGEPLDAISIVEEGEGGGRALRLRPASASAGVRACRSIPVTGLGEVRVDLTVRVSGFGTADSSILSLRGAGGEAASVRVTERGEFAWFDGATKVRTTAIVDPGRWYRVRVGVDQVAKTYTLTLGADGRDPAVDRTGIDWRQPEVPSVRDLCLETAIGDADLTIDVAEVRVLQEPDT